MKNLFCIRHGTAEHNVLFHEIGEQAYMSIRDSNLTEEGVVESKLLGQNWVDKNSIELVLVSPLTRTIETAQNIFKDTNVKILAFDELKEYPGSYEPINHRKDRNELVIKYNQNVNFKHISEKDSIWNETDIESIEMLEKRVKKMKEFILSRKENNIAIVSHSSYLAYFLKGKITDTNNELKHCFPYTMFLKSPTNYI